MLAALPGGAEMSRPQWDQAPPWANYLAMDEDGFWEWHELPPRLAGQYGQYWVSAGQTIKASDGGFNWRDSLEERPNA